MFWIANRPFIQFTHDITVMILTSANSDINRCFHNHSLLVFLCFNFVFVFAIFHLCTKRFQLQIYLFYTSNKNFKRLWTLLYSLSSSEREDVPWVIFNVIKLYANYRLVYHFVNVRRKSSPQHFFCITTSQLQWRFAKYIGLCSSLKVFEAGRIHLIFNTICDKEERRENP